MLATLPGAEDTVTKQMMKILVLKETLQPAPTLEWDRFCNRRSIGCQRSHKMGF